MAVATSTTVDNQPARPVVRAPRRKRPSRFTPGLVGSYALVLVYAATLVLPLYWLFISAFKSQLDAVDAPFAPTFSSGFDNLTRVWDLLNLGDAMLNSLYITAASLAVTLVIAIPAAYALARSQGRIATVFERIYALGFLIPGFAALVPTLLLAIQLDLFHTREFMILYLPASAQPLAVILLTQFMRTVPQELEESATIDGAGRFRVLRSIYLPLTMPGIATISILNFISFWNDYLYTLVIVGANAKVRTVQVALPTLQGNQGITDYALVCAGTLISVLPVFVVYAVLNRRMESALVQGALKG
ncbi:transporter [Asanoa ishikariensis]|uniref:Carbohydrate ABC transporter membrane protein 2, CUT1 family n=1 Tax=Asanoa ishikariensis TaxID=137265 RepID=A0A1H3UIU3_9ACTN|nr:carbohydrate ABC transporter permease [Asanoa ishikariensis]GIF63494.1 transporter [Asanoa ishikariensis]SDZ61941.1 carbohydrate ABC transporter membrane protein 2, CUT1 family [Asanoa ishikariensis]